MQNQQRRISPIEGLLVVGLVFWLFFMGGLGSLKKAKVTDTLNTGVQRLVATAKAAAPDTTTAEKPSASTKTAGGDPTRSVTLPIPPAAGAGVPNAAAPAAAPAAQPTAVPAPTALPAAGGAAPAAAPAAPAPALAFSVPEGQHTNINPDGSFTVDGGNTRYYPDTNGVIVDVRLKGSEDYLKNLPEPTAAPPTAVYVAPTPSFIPCAGRHGCPKPKSQP